MLLTQVLFQARELVQDVDVEDTNRVQNTHGYLSIYCQAEAHEPNEQNENPASTKSVHKAKVNSNISSNGLVSKKEISIMKNLANHSPANGTNRRDDRLSRSLHHLSLQFVK